MKDICNIRYKHPTKISIVNYFFKKRHNLVISCIENLIKQDSLILDLGCGDGRLFPKLINSQLLDRATVIGCDIDSKYLTHIRNVYKKFVRQGKIQLICLDISNLPFREEIIDSIICTSVFEHLLELEEITKKIKKILKKNGILVAGYPVETKLLLFLLKIFYSKTNWTINPSILGIDEYRKNPHTHKHNYRFIDQILKRNFTIQKIKNIPLNLPNFFSLFKVVLVKK